MLLKINDGVANFFLFRKISKIVINLIYCTEVCIVDFCIYYISYIIYLGMTYTM